MFRALKQEMKNHGTNQRKLAARLGICEKSMSHKMTNQREFTRAEMLLICEQFGKSLDYLFGENA